MLNSVGSSLFGPYTWLFPRPYDSNIYLGCCAL